MVAGALAMVDSTLEAVTTTVSPRPAIFSATFGTSTAAPVTVTSWVAVPNPDRLTVSL